ncbi:MAG TPA: ferrochelatase, partial [Longimicrobiales bacterium]
MTLGVILLNFGEPSEATLGAVVPFLERIFLTNASLEGAASPEAVRARCHELAQRRAPGLIAEYQAIGGSPLNAQSEAQAEALAGELERRGHAARVYVANQFADPLIPEVLRRARADGVQQLVGLPVYPVCGPSTNVAALAQLRDALGEIAWDVPLVEVSGWHRHPAYVAMRAAGIRKTAGEQELDLG